MSAAHDTVGPTSNKATKGEEGSITPTPSPANSLNLPKEPPLPAKPSLPHSSEAATAAGKENTKGLHAGMSDLSSMERAASGRAAVGGGVLSSKFHHVPATPQPADTAAAKSPSDLNPVERGASGSAAIGGGVLSSKFHHQPATTAPAKPSTPATDLLSRNAAEDARKLEDTNTFRGSAEEWATGAPAKGLIKPPYEASTGAKATPEVAGVPEKQDPAHHPGAGGVADVTHLGKALGEGTRTGAHLAEADELLGGPTAHTKDAKHPSPAPPKGGPPTGSVATKDAPMPKPASEALAPLTGEGTVMDTAATKAGEAWVATSAATGAAAAKAYEAVAPYLPGQGSQTGPVVTEKAPAGAGGVPSQATQAGALGGKLATGMTAGELAGEDWSWKERMGEDVGDKTVKAVGDTVQQVKETAYTVAGSLAEGSRVVAQNVGQTLEPHAREAAKFVNKQAAAAKAATQEAGAAVWEHAHKTQGDLANSWAVRMAVSVGLLALALGRLGLSWGASIVLVLLSAVVAGVAELFLGQPPQARPVAGHTPSGLVEAPASASATGGAGTGPLAGATHAYAGPTPTSLVETPAHESATGPGGAAAGVGGLGLHDTLVGATRENLGEGATSPQAAKTQRN